MSIIMPRPKKYRLIGETPLALYFKPRGIPLRDLEEIELSLDELETIKLKDLKGLNQEECAKRMQISRATFARILRSARKKIARFLLEAKALKIDEKVRLINARKYRCLECLKEFEIRAGKNVRSTVCPFCGSDKFESLHKILWR